MTDADWCRENDISVRTFITGGSICQKVTTEQIPVANYVHLEIPHPKQCVIPIDIVPEQHTAS